MNFKSLGTASAVSLALVTTAQPATVQESFKGWLKVRKEQIQSNSLGLRPLDYALQVDHARSL